MPIYAYFCDCGEKTEEYRKIDERHRAPACNCGQMMNRGIERSNINPDLEPYLDENLVPQHSSEPGTWVKSRQHKRELLKDLGLGQL